MAGLPQVPPLEPAMSGFLQGVRQAILSLASSKLDVKSKFSVQRKTSAEWASSNPILALGDLGYETDTRYLKVGDGITPWTALNRIVT